MNKSNTVDVKTVINDNSDGVPEVKKARMEENGAPAATWDAQHTLLVNKVWFLMSPVDKVLERVTAEETLPTPFLQS